MTSPLDPLLLAQSYAFCAEITRRCATNFYYALKLVPQPKRSAMFALYAYMRTIDDVADDNSSRTAQDRAGWLEGMRNQTHAALDIGAVDHSRSIWPAFAHTVRQYQIPSYVFDHAIAGQLQDLQPLSFATFTQLQEYCYRVAGTVGVASIHIWGFQGGQPTIDLAVDRGVAFQITNVLRDLREDLARGRIYLPREELAHTQVTEDDLRRLRPTDAFVKLMRFQIERAMACFDRSAPLDNLISADCRPALRTMTRIYHAILDKIAANPQRVLRGRVSLSPLSKLLIAWRALRST